VPFLITYQSGEDFILANREMTNSYGNTGQTAAKLASVQAHFKEIQGKVQEEEE
jgi:hypothetical protein